MYARVPQINLRHASLIRSRTSPTPAVASPAPTASTVPAGTSGGNATADGAASPSREPDAKEGDEALQDVAKDLHPAGQAAVAAPLQGKPEEGGPPAGVSRRDGAKKESGPAKEGARDAGVESPSASKGPDKKTSVFSTTLSRALCKSYYLLHVSFVSEVSNREHRYLMITAAVVLTLTVAIFAFLVYLYLTRQALRIPVACDTVECARARAFLDSLLDHDKDKCSDFYGHVCSSWTKPGTGFLEDSVRAHLVKLNGSLFQGSTSVPDKEGMQGMRVLYRTCHWYVASDETLETVLRATHKYLNATKLRRASSFAAIVSLIAHASLVVGIHTILRIEVILREGKPLLHLSAGMSLLRRLTHAGDVKELEFSMRRVVEAPDTLQRLLTLDRRVESDLEDVHEQVTGPLERVLRDVVPEVTTGEWLAAINMIVTPTIRLVASDLVVGEGMPSVTKAFRSVAGEGVPTAAAYLAAHWDAEAILLADGKSRAKNDPLETARFCLRLTHACLTSAWPQLVDRLFDTDGSYGALESMFRQLQKTSRDPNVLTWLPGSGRGDAGEKVDRLVLSVVGKGIVGRSAGYESLSVDVELTTDLIELYFEMLVYDRVLRLQYAPTTLQLLLSNAELENKLAYSAVLRAILVPTLYQTEHVFYAESVPVSFNYGTVGTVLAAKIVEAIGPPLAAAVQSRASPDPLWTPATYERYNATIFCLQRLHRHLGLEYNESWRWDKHWRDMFMRVQGLRIAYNSLLASFRSLAADEAIFATYWPEAQTTFFMRFCLLWCGAGEKRRDSLTPRGNCEVPLHNMPEFRTAFGCVSHHDIVAEECPL